MSLGSESNIKLQWKLSTKNDNSASHCIKYLVRLNREIGPVMAYISTNYTKSDSRIIVIRTENNILSYEGVDKVSLKKIDSPISWSEEIKLVKHEENSVLCYFKPLPNIIFIQEGKKLFTQDSKVMVVNIDFIIHSILTGNIEIKITGIREINRKKEVVYCMLPCGSEILSIIQRSLKKSLFN